MSIVKSTLSITFRFLQFINLQTRFNSQFLSRTCSKKITEENLEASNQPRQLQAQQLVKQISRKYLGHLCKQLVPIRIDSLTIPCALRSIYKGQSCEEVDCCGKPVPKLVKPITIEKECGLKCPFKEYKPRIPVLVPEYKGSKAVIPKYIKPCTPNTKHKSEDCPYCIREKSKECFSSIRPDAKIRVRPKLKGMQMCDINPLTFPFTVKKLPPTPQRKPKPCLPVPDWDHDKHME